jgi:hypothetical protein
MSFTPNPATFAVGAENVNGQLVFHNSSIDLVFFEKRGDDSIWPIERIFRTASGEALRRRWWSFTEVGATKTVRIAKLTFRGSKFSASMGFNENGSECKPIDQLDPADKRLYDAFAASERISIEIPFPQGRIATLVLELRYTYPNQGAWTVASMPEGGASQRSR